MEQAKGDGFCPWCDYDLRGIARPRLCPECGKGLSPESRAMAERGQAQGRSLARLVLFASPLVVIVVLVSGILVHGQGVLFVGVVGAVILGLSGFVALYYGRRRDRRSWTAAALGALPLGLAYFAGAAAIALIVVLILAAFTRCSDMR